MKDLVSMMSKGLVAAVLTLTVLIVAPDSARAGTDLEGRTTQECNNCAPATYYGAPVHYWKGTEGCEIVEMRGDSCRICDTEDNQICDDPSIPHDDVCPTAQCGTVTFLLDAIHDGELKRVAPALMDAREHWVLDVGSRRLTAQLCDGTVRSVILDAEEMRTLAMASGVP